MLSRRVEFDLLSNPIRLEVCRSLVERELTAFEIACQVRKRKGAIEKHLIALKQHDLISVKLESVKKVLGKGQKKQLVRRFTLTPLGLDGVKYFERRTV